MTLICLLSEGYLRLRFGELIFGRASRYFFLGGGVRGDVGVLIIEVLQQSLSKLNHYLWAYVNAK